jgi:hypothetical protein
MFSITKYEHEFLEKEGQKIKLFFNYNGNIERKIEVQIYENAFNVRWYKLGGIITVNNNVNYWVEDNRLEKFEAFYNNDVIVNFIDYETKKILDIKKLPTSKVNISKRSLGGDFSKNNTWVIGDSHINHFLSHGIDYDIKNFETKNTIINPLSFPLLSINRFVNSDYLKIFKNLPIFDGDNICLFFGEIDTRIGIIRNSGLKKITYTEHIINLVNRFIEVIKIIKKEYKNCNFYYILPNPPLKDGWINGDKIKEFLDNSNEITRFNVRYTFEDIIINEMNKIDVNIINIYKNYITSDMFVDESFLIENNHHFKTPNNFLNLLKNKFN